MEHLASLFFSLIDEKTNASDVRVNLYVESPQRTQFLASGQQFGYDEQSLHVIFAVFCQVFGDDLQFAREHFEKIIENVVFESPLISVQYYADFSNQIRTKISQLKQKR